MADDDLDLSNPQPIDTQQGRKNSAVLKALKPDWLDYKYQPPAYPPQGLPNAKVGPGDLTDANLVLKALPDVLSWLTPGAKAATTAGKTLGTFLGPMAKNWNMPNQLLAKGMELKGHSPEQIFDATGLFKGHEGDWRSEISDIGMKVKPLPGNRKSVMGNIQSFIEHPKLFENYPDLANMKMAINPSYGSELHGNIDPDIKKITVGGKISEKGLTPAQRGVLLHELSGHGVQNIEGWQPGGNPEELAPQLGQRLADAYQKTKDPDLYRNLLAFGKKPKDVSKEAYWRLPGEAEARNIQDRYRYDLVGLPFHWPQTEDPESVSAALKNAGVTWSHVNPDRLPNDLRILYDRQPARRSDQGTPLTMMGNRRYPWKTEDIPRRLQFDYTK